MQLLRMMAEIFPLESQFPQEYLMIKKIDLLFFFCFIPFFGCKPNDESNESPDSKNVSDSKNSINDASDKYLNQGNLTKLTSKEHEGVGCYVRVFGGSHDQRRLFLKNVVSDALDQFPNRVISITPKDDGVLFFLKESVIPDFLDVLQVGENSELRVPFVLGDPNDLETAPFSYPD